MTEQEVIEKFKAACIPEKLNDRINSYAAQFQKNIYQIQEDNFQIRLVYIQDAPINHGGPYQLQYQQRQSKPEVFFIIQDKFNDLKRIFFGCE